MSVERLSLLMEGSLRLECLLQVPHLSERRTMVKTHERLLVFCMRTLCNCMFQVMCESVFCVGIAIMIRMLYIHTYAFRIEGQNGSLVVLKIIDARFTVFVSPSWGGATPKSCTFWCYILGYLFHVMLLSSFYLSGCCQKVEKKVLLLGRIHKFKRNKGMHYSSFFVLMVTFTHSWIFNNDLRLSLFWEHFCFHFHFYWLVWETLKSMGNFYLN